MIRMYRDERLQVIEEEPYKKGGKVRKGKKKAKKVRKGTAKARKTRKAEAMRYLPLGGALPTTGMGSVVFGAPQAPSYFRAVAPEQQTFASLPGSLKALQEGQQKLFKELERQKERLRADEKMARSMAEAEAEEKQETTRKYVSPMSSRAPTPIMSYMRGSSPAVSSTAVVPPPIQTLTPLQRRRSTTPDIMTPIVMPSPSFKASIPESAISVHPSWSGAMSSREAGYRGADETLPLQAPASGANMVPVDIVYDAVPDSAFVPLNASAPESVGDAVERASQVARLPSRSQSAPPRAYIVPGTKKFIGMRRPVMAVEMEGKEEAPGEEAPLKTKKIPKELQKKVYTVKMAKEYLAKKRAEKEAQPSSSGVV